MMNKKKKQNLFLMIIIPILLLSIFSCTLIINTIIYNNAPYLDKANKRGSIGDFSKTEILKRKLDFYLIDIDLPDIYLKEQYLFENYNGYFYSTTHAFTPLNMTFRPRAFRKEFIYELKYGDTKTFHGSEEIFKYYNCKRIKVYADALNQNYDKVYINNHIFKFSCECEGLDISQHDHYDYLLESEIFFNNDTYIITAFTTEFHRIDDLDKEYMRILKSFNAEFEGLEKLGYLTMYFNNS